MAPIHVQEAGSGLSVSPARIGHHPTCSEATGPEKSFRLNARSRSDEARKGGVGHGARADRSRSRRQLGGVLRLLGKDVSEVADFISAKLAVVESARLRLVCRCCERIFHPPARRVARAVVGGGGMAHTLGSMYDDYLPLYCHGEILARQAVENLCSTRVDRCGQVVATLRPLIEERKNQTLISSRNSDLLVLETQLQLVQGLGL